MAQQEIIVHHQKPYFLARTVAHGHATELLAHANGEKGDGNFEWLLRDGIDEVGLDLESTLLRTEAFATWGKIRGVESYLTTITNQVQAGAKPFSWGVAERLRWANPTDEMIAQVNAQYFRDVDPYARPVLRGLQVVGKRIRIVSMGFENTMVGLPEYLGVPIYGGKLFFHRRQYAGFRDDGLLAQDNGKQKFIVSQERRGQLRGTLAFVGDGVTDMIQRANFKVGVGIHEEREAVRQRADAYIYHLPVILVLLSGEKGWYQLANCKDQEVAHTFRIGMQQILNGAVTFQNKALEMALCARLLHFVDPRRDRDIVLFRNVRPS